MNRPWLIWSSFALCLAVVLAAMGWTTLTVLRLEDTSRRQQVREENVRLALWRMDSSLAPLLAQESAVPYFAYGAFYPAGRSYAEMFNSTKSGEAIMPSPLLTGGSPHALLYFQFDENGQLSSPQVPTINKLQFAKQVCASPEKVVEYATRMLHLQSLVTREQILERLPVESPNERPPVQVFIANDNNALGNGAPQQQIALPQNANTGNNSYVPAQQSQANPQVRNEQVQRSQNESLQDYTYSRQSKSTNELQKRDQNRANWQSYNSTSLSNTDGGNAIVPAPAQNPLVSNGNTMVLNQDGVNCIAPVMVSNKSPNDVSQGLLMPVWAGSELLLARRVSVGGKNYVQGCWVDWNWMQARLLSDIRDLLPDAKLEPVGAAEAERAPNRLAALPVKLSPGTIIPLETEERLSPVRISLLIAWGCALLAAGAVASLLFGAVTLSERRGAFVSAVTHELRTPLTTFRMYAEMLAGGMVPTREAQQTYLNTLSAEAGRLSHLVENVLSYARLERGSARSQVERVSADALIDKIVPRLNERAAQAGMNVSVDFEGDASNAELTTDVTAVEQILFNLVDNACKYAAHGNDKEIKIRVAQKPQKLSIKVCDSGPGFTKLETRRLFRPFSKSAREAAHSAPGVGLGLALSRRLARDLKGDLALERGSAVGACFELTLPNC